MGPEGLALELPSNGTLVNRFRIAHVSGTHTSWFNAGTAQVTGTIGRDRMLLLGIAHVSGTRNSLVDQNCLLLQDRRPFYSELLTQVRQRTCGLELPTNVGRSI